MVNNLDKDFYDFIPFFTQINSGYNLLREDEGLPPRQANLYDSMNNQIKAPCPIYSTTLECIALRCKISYLEIHARQKVNKHTIN